MPRVNPDAVRTRLQSLPTLDAAAVASAVRDLGKDGVLSASDRQLLDAFLPAMTAEAKARYGALVGETIPGSSAPARGLSAQGGFAQVEAGTKVLGRGATGPEVRSLQEALLRLNFGTFSPTDTFGPRTEQALKEFQIHHNDRLAGTTAPQGARQLTVDGKLGRDTLKALDQALATLPTAVALLGGGLDKADVVVDLKKQRAYVNAALIDPAKLQALATALSGEPVNATARPVYEKLIAKVSPNGVPVDDYDVKTVKTEAQLGLAGSDGEDRVFVSFPIAVGEVQNGASLTPTGSFVVGDKRRNREAIQWDHPDGFSKDPGNPFGPRWMRLYRETAAGPSHTAYGFHGTTANATWMNRGDGDRAVSHGCMRFANDDIVKLFQYLPNGAKVRIVKGLPDGA